jgi:integrase
MKDINNLTFKDFEKFKAALDEAGSYQSADVCTIISNTGLKVSEVLNLKFSDIDFKSKNITIYKLRSSVSTTIIVNSECIKTLKRLHNKYPNDIFVFQSRKSKNQKNKPPSSISRQVVHEAFKRASDTTSLTITMNSWRQYYAVQVFKESVSSNSDSASLSTIMGHLPTNMTNHYIKYFDIKNKKELPSNTSIIKNEEIEYLLNGTSINKYSDLIDTCQKNGISESELMITLKTIKILRNPP